MVVDDAAGLHGRVGGHRAGEGEAVPLELGAQGFGGRRGRGHVGQCPRRRSRLARVLPDQRVQAVGQAERGARVGDCRVDLGPVPDDAGVGHQPGDVLIAERGHGGGVEPGEGGAEVLPLAQDRQPGQPGLEALQAEPLEDRRVAVQRAAPLLVVVGDVLGRVQPPRAAQLPVRPRDRAIVAHQPCSSAAATDSSSCPPAAWRLACSSRAASCCSAHQPCVSKAPCGPGASSGAVVAEDWIASCSSPGSGRIGEGWVGSWRSGLGPEALRTSAVCGGPGTGTVGVASAAAASAAAASAAAASAAGRLRGGDGLCRFRRLVRFRALVRFSWLRGVEGVLGLQDDLGFRGVLGWFRGVLGFQGV